MTVPPGPAVAAIRTDKRGRGRVTVPPLPLESMPELVAHVVAQPPMMPLTFGQRTVHHQNGITADGEVQGRPAVADDGIRLSSVQREGSADQTARDLRTRVGDQVDGSGHVERQRQRVQPAILDVQRAAEIERALAVDRQIIGIARLGRIGVCIEVRSSNRRRRPWWGRCRVAGPVWPCGASRARNLVIAFPLLLITASPPAPP